MKLREITVPDLDKTIRGLECCVLWDPDDKPRCDSCTYEGNCLNRLKQDALALLREAKAAGYHEYSEKHAI